MHEIENRILTIDFAIVNDTYVLLFDFEGTILAKNRKLKRIKCVQDSNLVIELTELFGQLFNSANKIEELE